MKVPPRLDSIDAFRGLAVAAMIVVNSPGSDITYPFLSHTAWHGWTPADLVFPGFLVIMGASVPLAVAARRARGETSSAIAGHALRRAAALFALGLLANLFVFDAGPALRWPGVPQRIAVCYFACVGLALLGGPRLWAAAAAAALGGYALILRFLAPPGCPPGALSPECAAAAWFDRALMGPHLFDRLYDPEGLLSTAPAIATAVFGMLAAGPLRRRRDVPLVALAGLGLAVVGAFWSRTLPLNKHLWTSSYALYCGGLVLVLIAAFDAACRRVPALARPWLPLGRNALAAYALSGAAYGLLEYLPGGGMDLKTRLASALFGGLPARAASLAFATAFLGACAAAAAALTRSARPR